MARATPTRAENVSVMEESDGFVRHQTIRKVERKKQTLSDKGMKVEEVEVIGYDVVEVTDFGLPLREAWNEIDRIQDFAQRVKQAINQANKAVGSASQAAAAVGASSAPAAAAAPAKKPASKFPKVGKNDPCPCGSGKRYKKCHGKPAAATV